jgi:hypothetical protein
MNREDDNKEDDPCPKVKRQRLAEAPVEPVSLDDDDDETQQIEMESKKVSATTVVTAIALMNAKGESRQREQPWSVLGEALADKGDTPRSVLGEALADKGDTPRSVVSARDARLSHVWSTLLQATYSPRECVATPCGTALKIDTHDGVLPEEGLMQPIVMYLQHHRGQTPPVIPWPLQADRMVHVCSDAWDAQWLGQFLMTHKYRWSALRQLLLAASWLDISCLHDLLAVRMAMAMSAPLSEQQLHRMVHDEEPMDPVYDTLDEPQQQPDDDVSVKNSSAAMSLDDDDEDPQPPDRERQEDTLFSSFILE